MLEIVVNLMTFNKKIEIKTATEDTFNLME